jgi:hypothetical protein
MAGSYALKHTFENRTFCALPGQPTSLFEFEIQRSAFHVLARLIA